MNMKSLLPLAACSLLLANTVLAGEGNMGDNEYACQVQTPDHGLGLVMIQADTMKIAREIAAQAPAITMDGKSAPTQHILECINVPGERFSNEEFWLFYLNLPR